MIMHRHALPGSLFKIRIINQEEVLYPLNNRARASIIIWQLMQQCQEQMNKLPSMN